MTLPVVVRYIDPRIDTPFVVRSWVESSHNGPVGRLHRKGTWHPQQASLATHLIATQPCLVAHQDGDRDQLYGWVCFAEPEGSELVVHYVYVKRPFRRFGIARHLLRAAGWQPGTSIVATQTSYLSEDGKLMTRYRVEHNLFLAHQ
jgi:GNAT superfamily N-acetyltransferase